MTETELTIEFPLCPNYSAKPYHNSYHRYKNGCRTRSQCDGRHRAGKSRRLFRRITGRRSHGRFCRTRTDQDGTLCRGLPQNLREFSSILYGRIPAVRAAHGVQGLDLSSGHQGLCSTGKLHDEILPMNSPLGRNNISPSNRTSFCCLYFRVGTL